MLCRVPVLVFFFFFFFFSNYIISLTILYHTVPSVHVRTNLFIEYAYILSGGTLVDLVMLSGGDVHGAFVAKTLVNFLISILILV